ncbi:Thioredoxin reductase [Elsinoe australis]|uniref:Thioredoxin reductase n=1 Tax=Elsinoe australis TaxID=40998 RepID=A0A2P8AI52_9PEZI|nr:Thioredoxin reductase [Elsinoe australis]
MSRPHPFQLLCKVSPNTNSESNVLVAACGQYLISASLSKQGDVPAGVIHSKWPPNSQNNNSEQDAAEPQQKKRKLDQRETSNQPSITLLIAAPDQQHIVAVTGADKCIRVFLVKGGALEELSQRCMPKRPCAIQVTEDSKTIVCADKFGDVYSLPLQHTTNGEGAAAESQSNGASKQKLYEPAAHETTVHTKRNLKALQEQMRAKGKPTNSTKEPLAFEHKLLLGHVSMLTDLQLVCHEVEGKRKRYIMTCDRDEHIRISRGIPQTHVIESYCLGHTEFVHCIRHIPGTTTLVSAGGDEWLGVWDWLTGKLLKKHSLRDIRQFEDEASEQESKAPIAVRNIWLMSSSKSKPLVVVSCEGVAALAVFEATNLLDAFYFPTYTIRHQFHISHIFNTVKLFSSPLRRFGTTAFKSSFALPFAAAAFYKPSTPPTSPLISHFLPPTPSLAHSSRAMHSKVVIIGSGPAGHTAAIYAARADLQPVLYEGFLALGIAAGGQLTTTDEVENYPGFKKIQGAELMDQMRAQSEACGTEIVSQTVGKVDFKSRPFKYWLHPMGDDESLEEEEHTADAVIIATGAKARRLDLPGEEKYWGNGVSACAVCDGSLPIFREKPLVVIGGGDSAVEEAIYLTKKASKVTVLVRRDVLRASKANARRLTTHPKVEVKYNTHATQVVGEEKERGLMTGLKIKNSKTGVEEEIQANGLFYAVGHEPATTLFKGQLEMDDEGYLITGAGNTHTNIEGVFAAGDVQDKKYRQAITSAGSGCIAALEAEKYLVEREDGPEESSLEKVSEAKKGDTKTNGETPEYTSNPLL